MPPSDGPVPKWSARVRSGAPGPDTLFPFDPETTGLALGLRRLVKREARDDAEAAFAEAWFEERGLAVRRHGLVVFAARDARELDLAVEAERAGDRDANAVRALGDALGYPHCCVEAYLGLSLRDDASLFAALSSRAQAPAETLWLVGPLALVSHAPCTLDCSVAYALGAALLAGLEAEYPGFAARWRALAARVHLITNQGRVLCLDADGDRIRAAHELVPPDAQIRTVPELAGSALDFSRLDARFVADHRGIQR